MSRIIINGKSFNTKEDICDILEKLTDYIDFVEDKIIQLEKNNSDNCEIDIIDSKIDNIDNDIKELKSQLELLKKEK